MVKYDLWGKEVEIDIPKDVFPSESELKDMEDMLPDAEHGWFKGTTGQWLHYRKYIPKDAPPKAICVYNHGIAAHSGVACKLSSGRITNYALLSKKLLEKGYALYMMDMVGHGFSEGLRFYIPGAKWTTNRDDLDNFARYAVAHHKPGTPLFIMGESYGGNLALNLCRKWQDSVGDAGARNPPEGFRGLLVIAPAIIGDLPPAPVTFVLRHILAPARPTWVPFFMPNPISPDRIWSDEEVKKIRLDPRTKEMNVDGSGKPFRLGTAVGMVEALEYAREYSIPGFQVPFCVSHGDKDGGVPIEGSYFLVENCSTEECDRVFQKLEGSFHDLLSEPTAETTMDQFLDWIAERIEKGPCFKKEK